jgi:aminoglycoside 6'-N-acetyltransferase I
MRVRVRPAVAADLAAITALGVMLWPDVPAADHEVHAAALLSGAPPSTLPLVIFVAALVAGEGGVAGEVGGEIVGFIEVGLRSHADGCDGRWPVGFVEGWSVHPRHQRQAIGRALMEAAEEWARTHGARELASDTWIDSPNAQRAHEALGFEVVDRCVHFRKKL